MLIAQPVHDRAFDLGQMQADAHFAQTCIDHFKRFECAEINVIHSGTLQNHVAHVFVASHAILNLIFKVLRNKSG